MRGQRAGQVSRSEWLGVKVDDREAGLKVRHGRRGREGCVKKPGTAKARDG